MINQIKIKNFPFKLLMVLLFITPIYTDSTHFFGFQSLRMYQQQFFQIGVTALFAISFLENLWLSLFLLWSLFSYAYYGYPDMAAGYVMNIFWGCLLYQLIYKLINRENAEVVFKIILGLVVFNLVVMVLQYAHYDPLYTNYTDKTTNIDLVGAFGIKAHCGMFLALALPLVAYFSAVVAPILFIPIAFSESSVAVAGAILAFSTFLWFTNAMNKKLLALLIAIMLIGGIAYVKHDTKANMFTDRFKLWQVVTRDGTQHSLIGWGLDSFCHVGIVKPFMYFKDYDNNNTIKMTYQPITNQWTPPAGYKLPKNLDGTYRLSPWEHPHNEFVSIFYEFGIVGIIIFVLLCIDILKRFDGSRLATSILCSFIALGVFCTGQYPFHIVRISYIYIALLAIYYKATTKQGVLNGYND